MTDRIALAARNNALWCDAVARSHGVSCSLDEGAWTATTRTPPFYPDAVTLSPTVGEYDLLARIDDSDGASVKDSWARLDLSMEDFARIVVGEWVWLAPEVRPTRDSSLVWRAVTTPADLGHWVRGWASDPDAAGILRPSLLEVAGVHVLGAHAASDPAGPVVAGAIVNVTGDVAGLGNVFAQDGDSGRAWSGAAAKARDLVGDLPLVGWEAGASIDAALAAGCERIGPLSVWLK